MLQSSKLTTTLQTFLLMIINTVFWFIDFLARLLMYQTSIKKIFALFNRHIKVFSNLKSFQYATFSTCLNSLRPATFQSSKVSAPDMFPIKFLRFINHDGQTFMTYQYPKSYPKVPGSWQWQKRFPDAYCVYTVQVVVACCFAHILWNVHDIYRSQLCQT